MASTRNHGLPAALRSIAATTAIVVLLSCACVAVTLLPLIRGSWSVQLHPAGGSDAVSLGAALLGSLLVAIGRHDARAPLGRRSTRLLLGALVPLAAGFFECRHFIATNADILCEAGPRLLDVVRTVAFASDDALSSVRAGALESGLLLLASSSFRADAPARSPRGCEWHGGTAILVATVMRAAVVAGGVHLAWLDLVSACGVVLAIVVVVQTSRTSRSALLVIASAIAAACLIDLGARTGATCALLSSLADVSLAPDEHLRDAREALQTESARGSLALVDVLILALLAFFVPRPAVREAAETHATAEDTAASFGKGATFTAIAALALAVVVAATPLWWSGVTDRLSALSAFFQEVSSPGDISSSYTLGSWRVPQALSSPLIVDQSGTLHTPAPPTLACPAHERELRTSVVVPPDLAISGVLESLRAVPSSAIGSRRFRFLRVRPDRAPAKELSVFGPLEQLATDAVADIAIEIDPDPIFLGTPTRPNQGMGMVTGVVVEGSEARLHQLFVDADGYHVAGSGAPVTIDKLVSDQVIGWISPRSRWPKYGDNSQAEGAASMKVLRMLVVASNARVDGVEAIAERLGDPITVAVSPEAVERAVSVACALASDGCRRVGLETPTEGPRGVVTLGAVKSDPPGLEDATAVVTRLKPRLRACYNAGLSSDPTMKGTATVAFVLNDDGAVANATAAGGDGLSEAVVNCILRKVKNSEFHPPGPRGARLSVPLTFTQDK